MAFKQEIDMLNGPLSGKLVRFALPIAASGLLQQLFNSADTAVVGRFAGSDSLAAVGGNGSLIFLLIGLFIGLAVGANVLMAGYTGTKNEQGMDRVLHTSVLFSLGCGLVLCGIGLLIAPLAHQLLGTGAEGTYLRSQAVAYFRIYFIGVPFILLYNFESAILRSKGDTKRPLIVLIISGVMNVGLNLLLVCVFGMAAEGVAIATVVSNIFNSLALFRILTRETGGYQLRIRSLRIHWPTLKKIVAIGLPAGIQSSMFSISNVIVQSSINALGPDVMAGTTVGLNAEFYSFQFLNGFSQAATTFVSQNYAAGKRSRIRSVVRRCLLFGGICTLAVSSLMVLFRDPIISIFTKDPQVAAVAADRMLRVGMLQFINGLGEIFSGSMRGMKNSAVPAVISILSICGVRLLWIFLIFPANPVYENLIVVYPLSWAVSLCAMAVAYIRTVTGKKAAVSSGT